MANTASLLLSIQYMSIVLMAKIRTQTLGIVIDAETNHRVSIFKSAKLAKKSKEVLGAIPIPCINSCRYGFFRESPPTFT
jgi:hypothetical protein